MEIIEKSYFLIYVQYSKLLKFLQNYVLLLYDFMRKQIYPPNSPFKIDQQLTNHRGGGKDSLLFSNEISLPNIQKRGNWY